jgi:hypothetical protein
MKNSLETTVTTEIDEKGRFVVFQGSFKYGLSGVEIRNLKLENLIKRLFLRTKHIQWRCTISKRH